MYKFFTKKPAPPVVVAAHYPPEYYALERQYVHLCINVTSVRYSTARAKLDFEELMLDDRVNTVAVNPVDRILLVGTREVFITHQGVTYHIGSFIIKLATEPREWLKEYKTHVHYERVTGHAIDPTKEHIHPHINEIGRICMSDGMNSLVASATNGDLAAAARIALQALWTIDSCPFLEITEWPVVQGGRHA